MNTEKMEQQETSSASPQDYVEPVSATAPPLYDEAVSSPVPPAQYSASETEKFLSPAPPQYLPPTAEPPPAYTPRIVYYPAASLPQQRSQQQQQQQVVLFIDCIWKMHMDDMVHLFRQT